MQTIQFFLLLFLGAITLIQNAQQRTYFNERELPRSLVYLLPNEENGISNLKDSVEEVRSILRYSSMREDWLSVAPSATLQGNINRVVTILQNNIKQWSFIEAQLLEPNVNLGMVSGTSSLCDLPPVVIEPSRVAGDIHPAEALDDDAGNSRQHLFHEE